LSHLHPAPILVDGLPWDTVEQPYQTAKAILSKEQSFFDRLRQEPKGRSQKIISKEIVVCHENNWDKVKYYIMLNLDYRKFDQNISLKEFLLATAPRRLLENNPSDEYWGPPKNAAGEIIESIRDHMLGIKGKRPLPEILIIGDSILKGLGQGHFSKELGKEVLCLALSGATAEYLFHACRYIVAPYITTVLFMGGTNTISTRENKARIGPTLLLKKFQRFAVRLCDANPHVRLIISNILNRPKSAGSTIEAHIRRFNEWVQQTEFPANCEILAFDEFDSSLFSDGLHLNKPGSQKLSDIFLQKLMLAAPPLARGVV
jgi:ribA/ribD-fused uncharacterized protein